MQGRQINVAGHSYMRSCQFDDRVQFLSAWRIADEPEAGPGPQAEIVGLYLSPPEGALVLSMDEKPSIQAVDDTSPGFASRRAFPRIHWPLHHGQNGRLRGPGLAFASRSRRG